MATVFNMLRKSLSGENQSQSVSPSNLRPSLSCDDPCNNSADSTETIEKRLKWGKQSKRFRSGDQQQENDGKHKKSKLSKEKVVSGSCGNSDSDRSEQLDTDDSTGQDEPLELPEGTLDWGITLLKIIQKDLSKVTKHVSTVELDAVKTKTDVKNLEQKIQKMEIVNQELKEENVMLKERLLDLKYRQKQCSLLFEGIMDSPDESDIECIRKL